jgi:hypothetical protein
MARALRGLSRHDTSAVDERKESSMKISALYQREEGALGYILLWLMGVPASILFLFFVLRGCT